jgi:plasmid replication initiation protein
MRVTNKKLIQDYVLTSAKFDFSTYEKRILYRIIEFTQEDLEEKKLEDSEMIQTNTFGDRVLKMSLSDFKKHQCDNNYIEIKKALTSLSGKIIEFETKTEWKRIGIVEKPRVDRYSSFANFVIPSEIWNALRELGKGYSKDIIEAALSFNSIYSIRFVELFGNSPKPVTFRIDDLKKRFDIEDKYQRPADFIKNVIEVAKREHDKKLSPSFNYQIIKEGRKMTKIRFVPKRIPTNEGSELDITKSENKVSHRFNLPNDLLMFLNGLGFSHDGIRNNLQLFKDLAGQQDLYIFLTRVFKKAGTAHNPQGYMIGAMRTALSKRKTNTEYNGDEKTHVLDLVRQLGEE